VGTPGSPDSPSICISIEKSEYEIGAQAYLDPSINVNSDSLSVWLEWLGAPNIIEKGTKISFSYTVSAHAPKEMEI